MQDYPITGGCQCGAVRYGARASPLQVYVCHCKACQRQSASAFGISVVFRSSDVTLLQGTLQQWSRPTGDGKSLDCFFCANCGSRLWHGNPQTDDAISIKGGSLDEPVDLRGAAHIWTSRMLPGVALPAGVTSYPQEPE